MSEITLELNDDVTSFPLPFFGIQDIALTRQNQGQRGILAPVFSQIGDRGVSGASTVSLKGPIWGDNHVEFLAKFDEHLSWFVKKSKWLIRDRRRILLGGRVSSTDRIEDKTCHRIEDYTVGMLLLFPGWLSNELFSHTEPLTGSDSFIITNDGNKITYPTIEITGADVTEVTIIAGSRTLSWSSLLPLGASALLIDNFLGNLTVAGASGLKDIQDGSQFLQLIPGANSFNITITGTSGQAVITHRDAYEI